MFSTEALTSQNSVDERAGAQPLAAAVEDLASDASFADAAEQLSATLGERVLESIGDIEPRRRPFAFGVIHSAPRRDEGEAYRSLHVQPTSRVGACGNRGS